MGFPANYSWELDPEFPGDGSVDVIRIGGPGAVAYALKISPANHKPWIAQLRGGDVRYRGWGVRTTPDPDVLAAFAYGAGYLINASDRSINELRYPVVQIEEAPDVGLLLVSDFTDLVGVGRDGVAWHSGRLALDDLEIEEVDGNVIRCRGSFLEDLGTSSRSQFTLDGATGNQTSGPVFVDPFGS